MGVWMQVACGCLAAQLGKLSSGGTLGGQGAVLPYTSWAHSLGMSHV